MVGLQWLSSHQHFSHVHSSHTKWYAKRGCTISRVTKLLIYIQQFVLLIQQVQAPEDLAAQPPAPSPQGPSTQSPSPPAGVTTPSSTGMPTNGQNTLTPAPTTPPSFSLQTPSRREMPLPSVVRGIFRSVLYDEHNRICAPRP
jgi:hypothetical protein